jgi:NAD-dependent SIR2 family protein deacetylase
MVHLDFITSETSRKKYWLRSFLGWNTFSSAIPNNAHFALSNLESKGYINHIITQNVDRLHQKSGSKKVIDLHGRNDRVICLSCKSLTSRRSMQSSLNELNVQFLEKLKNLNNNSNNNKFENMRADGDMEIFFSNLDDVNFYSFVFIYFLFIFYYYSYNGGIHWFL